MANSVVVNVKWCKKCGLCASVCPKQVFDWKEGEVTNPVRLEDCIACMQCENACPDFAVKVYKER